MDSINYPVLSTIASLDYKIQKLCSLPPPRIQTSRELQLQKLTFLWVLAKITGKNEEDPKIEKESNVSGNQIDVEITSNYKQNDMVSYGNDIRKNEG